MLSILVAMDQNRLIGKDNQLPWHLPADLQYFKRVTMGKAIIMGRKTFESIGKPLPGRKNIVVTRKKDFHPSGCETIHSIDMIKQLQANCEEAIVIGGAEIIEETLPFTDRLYITEIEASFEGNTYFPAINHSEWELVSKEKGIKDEKNPFDYYFCVYDRLKH